MSAHAFVDYLARVKVSIAETKRLAVRFKQLQQMNGARRALERLKLMQREVEEAESATLQ